MQLVPQQAIYPDKTDVLPFLLTASSDGYIKIWDLSTICSLDPADANQILPVKDIFIDDRITSLAASYPVNFTKTSKFAISLM
jgi:WD40 repeat protein